MAKKISIKGTPKPGGRPAQGGRQSGAPKPGGRPIKK